MARGDEPDDGGLDWLQSQLGADSESDESDEPGASDTPEPAAPEEPAWFASLPKRTDSATPRAAEPAAADADSSERTTAMGESAAGDAVGSDAVDPTTPAFDTVEPPTAKFETANFESDGAQPSTAPDADQEPTTDAAAPASAFSWGLTPSNDPDPKVAPSVKPEPTPLPAPQPTAPPETGQQPPIAPASGGWSLSAADEQAPVPADSPVPTAPVVPPVLPTVASPDVPPVSPSVAPVDDTPGTPAAHHRPSDEDPSPATSVLPVDSAPIGLATPGQLPETEALGSESQTPAVGADRGAADRGIRTEADLEPEPWWTTPVQAPLVPTDEERNAGLFPTPVAATPEPATPTPGQTASATQPPAAASAGVTENDSRAAPRRGRRGQAPSSSPTGGAGTGRTDNPKTTRTLIWIAVALGAVIVLVGLFFLGRQLVGGTPVAAPSSSPSPTATPTPTPTPPPAPTAPQPAGVHAWDTLFGSECVEPYASPWDEEFTVVDCATPHTAQLVYRGAFPGDATTAFPGEAALAAQINVLCSAPGVIDLAAAGGLPDLQLQGSYPVSDEQWTSGQRNYYCFVSRSSGEPLTASIAGPGPAPAA